MDGASEKYTSNWDVSDIQCKLDLLELDRALSNEYTSHLLSGKTLPINFSTWNHTNQSTGGDKNFSAHINRALTRLKSVFITLQGDEDAHYKQANQFSIQFILLRMTRSCLKTNTSIGFKSVQNSFQNILLNLLHNHFLNSAKQLVDLSRCTDDGIAPPSILLDSIWRRSAVLASPTCQRRLVISVAIFGSSGMSARGY